MRTSWKVTTYIIFYLVTLDPLDRVRIFIVASIKKVFDCVDLEYKSAQPEVYFAGDKLKLEDGPRDMLSLTQRLQKSNQNKNRKYCETNFVVYLKPIFDGLSNF